MKPIFTLDFIHLMKAPRVNQIYKHHFEKLLMHPKS